jgi:hypothetical protein
MGFQNWLEGLRKWIDGEDALDEQGQVRPRSKWDDFLVAIAREVEEAMKSEMFTPPGGPTYIPREYLVFLNPEDDADWQGEKREGLERGLHYVLSERARELAGENQFQTRTLAVELRVDPALERGRFRVQHVWDTEASKTLVTPRKKAEAVTPQPAESDEEATVVRARARDQAEPKFRISVRRKVESETAEQVLPFFKDQIAIGRGSRQVPVDLRLEGDMEISRRHATLLKAPDGCFKITCHGANAIVIDGSREIATNESGEVKAGDRIEICSYEMVIQ